MLPGNNEQHVDISIVLKMMWEMPPHAMLSALELCVKVDQKMQNLHLSIPCNNTTAIYYKKIFCHTKTWVKVK